MLGTVLLILAGIGVIWLILSFGTSAVLTAAFIIACIFYFDKTRTAFLAWLNSKPRRDIVEFAIDATVAYSSDTCGNEKPLAIRVVNGRGRSIVLETVSLAAYADPNEAPVLSDSIVKPMVRIDRKGEAAFCSSVPDLPDYYQPAALVWKVTSYTLAGE